MDEDYDFDDTVLLNYKKDLDVPIIVLEISQGQPILIDGRHLAMPTNDGIIAVHNTNALAYSYPLQVACNDGLVGYETTASYPAIVDATMNFLSGLAPTHLGYSPVHKKVLHDWTWSTGLHSSSLVTPGWVPSQMRMDAYHRSIIINAIDIVSQTMEKTIARLHLEPTSPEAAKHLKTEKVVLKQAYDSYLDIMYALLEILSDAARLDFMSAVEMTLELEDLAMEFDAAVNALVNDIHPQRCKAFTHRQRAVDTRRWIVLGVLGLLCAGLGYWYRKRKNKPMGKIV